MEWVDRPTPFHSLHWIHISNEPAIGKNQDSSQRWKEGKRGENNLEHSPCGSNVVAYLVQNMCRVRTFGPKGAEFFSWRERRKWSKKGKDILLAGFYYYTTCKSKCFLRRNFAKIKSLNGILSRPRGGTNLTCNLIKSKITFRQDLSS